MKNRKAPRDKQTLDPESEAWNKLPWRKLEQHVYRIQKRIYRASQRGNARAVQKLQKLLTKSEAARLLAVRRVTQDNQGKKTAGVDGVKAVRPKQRLVMAQQIHPKHWKQSQTKPVRRVWIPKPGKDEKRPLGIPTMFDRAKQALGKMALEPEWEAKFEPNSYGFRPGRSCHDAIEAIYGDIKQKPKFVYDADIKGCFDHINQQALLEKLHTYAAMRQAIKGWLKAGVLEGEVFTPTQMGTPQGGVISPLLANIALHGMEEAVKVGYGKSRAVEKPKLIRYADDFVIIHSTREAVERAAEITEQWLSGMGLHLNPKKTRLTHTLTPVHGQVGFHFLGFSVRQYRTGKTHTGKVANQWSEKKLEFQTHIKPGKEETERHLREIKQRLKKLYHRSQEDVIEALNPVIRGWADYYKTVVSSEVFNRCDMALYTQLASWGKRKHPTRGKRWIQREYWQTIGNNHWVFATQTSEGMKKIRTHGMTQIQRFVKVKGTASPYDGNLLYWYKRLKDHPLMESEKAKLLSRQKGMCPKCGLYFREGDLLEVDHITPTAMGGKDDLSNKWVFHRHCHDEKTAEDLARIAKWKAAGINE
jgi:RNA-directed DNA polymerase